MSMPLWIEVGYREPSEDDTICLKAPVKLITPGASMEVELPPNSRANNPTVLFVRLVGLDTDPPAAVDKETREALQSMEDLLWRMRYLLVEATSDGSLREIRNELGSVWTDGAHKLIAEHNEFVKRWGNQSDGELE